MEAVMDPVVVAKITAHFEALTALVPLRTISNKTELEKAIVAMNQLLDAGGSDEAHPLAGLVDTLGALIDAFEAVHNPAEKVAPAAILRLLMDQKGLSQSDLPEIGSQGVVSEILRGKRDLNLRQIRALAAKFHVPASLFV
ncbi:MAG: helix-turn-helix domain-containing protein [Pseudomonadota bacterium]